MIAGGGGGNSFGADDGIGSIALFNSPRFLTEDPVSGTIYVSDNNGVKAISSTGNNLRATISVNMSSIY